MLTGKVIKLDHVWKSGIIVEETTKTEFLFILKECYMKVFPALNSTVTFKKDTDYKVTNVASEVRAA